MFLFFCLKILPLLVMAVTTVENSAIKDNLRIIGGHDAMPDKYPYVVRLEYKDVLKNSTGIRSHHACTASVLSSEWTITSAHCIVGSHVLKSVGQLRRSRFVNYRSDQYQLVIRYGTPDGKPGPDSLLSEVLGVTEFPGKRMTPQSFEDVILLKTQPILLKQYAKISGVDFTTIYGHEVIVVGYGHMNYTNSHDINDTLTLGKPLQVVNGMIGKCYSKALNSKVLSSRAKYFRFEYPVICVAPRCSQNSRIGGGDSGGPVLHPSGVIALNRGTPRYREPPTNYVLLPLVAYVTPLSLYIEWISSTVYSVL